MVYSPPRNRGLADAIAHRRATNDAYQAAVRALPAAQREAIEAHVSALRGEAAAHRVDARDRRGAR